MTLSLVLLTYSGSTWLGGNGFLAVYLAGLMMGNSDFIHKRSLMRFHDGVAWLMQIAMFLTLGLQVFPSQLIPVAGNGILLALFLMVCARPLAVFLTLAFTSLSMREKTMVAWVGLRGVVPIILATFPLLAGIPQATMICSKARRSHWSRAGSSWMSRCSGVSTPRRSGMRRPVSRAVWSK